MTLQKKRTLYKAFVESQFKYCPLTWMFHGRKTNYKINRLQEQAFRLIYNDYISSFEELFMSKILFGYRNVQSIKWSFNTRFFRTISVKWVITWFKGQMDLKNFVFPKSTLLDLVKVLFDTLVQWSGILYQQKLGMLILCHLLRNIRKWKPSNCQCRLCVDFLGGIGFTNRE